MLNILDVDHLKDQPEELQKILQTLFSQGKSLRSKLIQIVGTSVHLDQESLLLLCRIIEYVHNSSLLHDDVLDQSAQRRSHPAAWLEFSPEQAVLAGDYLLARVNTYLAQKGSLDLLHLVAKSINDLVKGEFLQRELIKNQNEDLNKVDQVSDLKTSTLFKVCLLSPFLLVREKRDEKLERLLNSIGYHLGLLFQRSDDLLDFSIRNKEKKSILIDLNQNYLNSFSCFLLSNKEKNVKDRFRKIKTIEEIHSLIPNFQSRLESFDELNQRLIHQTEKQIQSLDSLLFPKEKILIEKLKNISEYLYYRKNL